jgi:uncharacterized protein (TIGR02118 family)
MAQTKLVVVYPQPKNVEEFEGVYVTEHVPLAKKIKGATRFVASRIIGSADGSTPPFYRVAEFYFPSIEALKEAVTDPAGQEAAAHAFAISTGGTPLVMIAEEETISSDETQTTTSASGT